MICLARHLPRFLARPLFGDRKAFGPVPDERDPDWKKWESSFFDFYNSTQKDGVGKKINDSGYEILRDIDLEGKQVCEIGPGSLPHMAYWRGKPAAYTAVDITPEFLEMTGKKVAQSVNCPFIPLAQKRDTIQLPVPDSTFDIIITFYSLEHLYPLEDYLREYARVLKPGGLLVGAVPNEGGMAWGLGRFLTSRRWIRKHTTINYDKIICWEHPNCVDYIFSELDALFERQTRRMYPLPFLPMPDANLVTKFIYKKPQI